MNRIRTIWIITCLFSAAACQGQTETSPQALVVTLPQDVAVDVVTEITPTATVTLLPSPTATVTETYTPTLLPSPTHTEVLSPTPTITASPVPETEVPTSSPTSLPSETPVPSPTVVEIEQHVDHYYLSRPIARQGVDYIDRTYAYGDTQRGNREVHHGVEFVNPRGTPVLAAAGGTVIFAGTDSEQVIGPVNDYYGHVVVIEHGIETPDGLPLYTVYAHLDRIVVEAGQVIQQGDRVGNVGDSGIALGPHLHFEVRVGDPFDYGATRNPDLWIYPYPRYGTLAGLVVDADGERAYGVGIGVTALDETGTVRYVFTYSDDSVNSDASWGENFTLGDLPEGDYELVISERGRLRYRGQVTIEANKTTWVDIVAN